MPLNTRITDWSRRTVWIVGGSAGIGEALGHAVHRQGARLIVSGRRHEALERAFPDAAVKKIVFDVNNRLGASQCLNALSHEGWLPDVIFWVAGDYQAQPIASFDPGVARRILETNLLSAYDGLAAVLAHWIHGDVPLAVRRRKANLSPPHISFFSSVAGYRGLPLALSYSASKAGLNSMAQTSFLELKPLGVDVSLVCPGFVQTRLTDTNAFQMPALISPEQAARQTLRGLANGDFEIHYPKRFTYFMKLLGVLPHRIYFWLARFALPGKEKTP
jgi:NAD(P)-dependent dehydrogenase (short-subunit alcohol dehydrogenase family)